MWRRHCEYRRKHSGGSYLFVIIVVLMLVAILAAVFSEKIDEVVNGNGLLRKVVLTTSVGIILVILVPVCMKLL